MPQPEYKAYWCAFYPYTYQAYDLDACRTTVTET
jgi:hypothetical protein